jgi:hypothetical protein
MVPQMFARGFRRPSFLTFSARRRCSFPPRILLLLLPSATAADRRCLRTRKHHIGSRMMNRSNFDEYGVLGDVAARTRGPEPVNAGIATRCIVDAQPEVEPGSVVPTIFVVCRHRLPVSVSEGRLWQVHCACTEQLQALLRSLSGAVF